MHRRPSNPAAKRALAWLAVLVLCLCMPQLWILCRSHDGDVQLELRGAAASCSHHEHAEPATHRHEAADHDHDHDHLPGNAGSPSCEHSELLLDTAPLPRPDRTAAPRAEPNAWASYLLALADGNNPVEPSRNAADPPPLPPDRQQRRALTTTHLLV